MSSSTPPPPPPPPGGSYPPPPEPEEPSDSSATGGYPPPPPPPGAGGGYTPPPSMPAPGLPGGNAGGNNIKAIIALVLGVLGLVFAFCCWPLGLILGIGGAVLGFLAKQEIARTGQAGRGLAQGGFVTGIIAVVLSIIVPVAFASLDLGNRITGS
ncbi:DUF4190 domain-containing protein [Phycicoccus jejuensis]|uniref:DUF4190 domain-containing protein n=1 Tax=Phycicoccus jejuensis TaxID=367299 RepID=UPI00384E1113